jgi:glycine/D-amino acid oxidase-like deaminating enzyme
MNFDAVVIGAGMVGAAIAYGLASRRVRVLLVDGDDRDFRAATANFGLVWSQGKGIDMPAYQQLTRDSVDGWFDFAAELEAAASIELQYERNGGLMLCLGEAEFEARRARMLRLQSQSDGAERDWEMIDRSALVKLLPRISLGPQVTGASFGHRDGHANPLRLLAALHAGFLRKSGQLRSGCTVRSVQAASRDSFSIDVGVDRVSAARVVIAAGLGSKALAAQVGLDIPIRPQRGQILVTERLESFLPLPLHSLRQTREGTVMIGTTHEEAGFDAAATCDAAATLSAKAIRWIPALSEVTLVRQWAGLRIMTPDSYPIYAQSPSCPGAFVATCHSGVTLAPTHAALFAEAVVAGRLPSPLEVFHHRRFDVPQAA